MKNCKRIDYKSLMERALEKLSPYIEDIKDYIDDEKDFVHNYYNIFRILILMKHYEV